MVMLQIVKVISIRINVYRICIEGISFSWKKKFVKSDESVRLMQHESEPCEFYLELLVIYYVLILIYCVLFFITK